MIDTISQYVQGLPEAWQYVWTLLIAAVPIIELRGAVPFGTALGLHPVAVYIISIIGNLLPIPFVVIFARTIINYLKKTKILGWFANWLEKRTNKKLDKVLRYEKIGLFLFVMVPLPGTGAYTGAIIASFLDLRLKNCFWPIALGVIAAGIIMSVLSLGIANMFA